MSIFRDSRILLEEKLTPSGSYEAGIGFSQMVIENTINDLSIFKAVYSDMVSKGINESFSSTQTVLNENKVFDMIVSFAKTIWEKLIKAVESIGKKINDGFLKNSLIYVKLNESKVRNKDLSKMQYNYRAIRPNLHLELEEIFPLILDSIEDNTAMLKDLKGFANGVDPDITIERAKSKEYKIDMIKNLFGNNSSMINLDYDKFTESLIHGIFEDDQLYQGLSKDKLEEVLTILKTGKVAKFTMGALSKALNVQYNIAKRRLTSLKDSIDTEEKYNIAMAILQANNEVATKFVMSCQDIYKMKLIEARAIFQAAVVFVEPVTEEVDITLNVGSSSEEEPTVEDVIPEPTEEDEDFAEDVVEDELGEEGSKNEKEEFSDKELEESFGPNTEWNLNYIYESIVDEFDESVYGIYQ